MYAICDWMCSWIPKYIHMWINLHGNECSHEEVRHVSACMVHDIHSLNRYNISKNKGCAWMRFIYLYLKLLSKHYNVYLNDVSNISLGIWCVKGC